MSYGLTIGRFTDDEDAAVTLLERYHASQDEIGIVEAVAIIKTFDGEDEVKMLGDAPKKGRRIGAVSGALLGLLGGPATLVVFGFGGAVAGDLIAKLTHAGISKKMIEAVEQGLEPSSSAVIVIVEEQYHHLIINDLEDRGATILSETIESHYVEGKYLLSPSAGASETQ